jgi:hypothetical protein
VVSEGDTNLRYLGFAHDLALHDGCAQDSLAPADMQG